MRSYPAPTAPPRPRNGIRRPARHRCAGISFAPQSCRFAHPGLTECVAAGSPCFESLARLFEYPCRAQLSDLGLVELEDLGEHLVGMLAEGRSGALPPRRGA